MGGDHAQPHKIDYVLSYIAHDIVDSSLAPSLAEQLQRHLMETNTLKESDLCGSDVLDERIFVSTIHKAKGLGNAVVLVAGGVGLPQRGLCARGSGDDGHAKGCKDCLHN